jgi:hypothetical protein
LPILDLQTPHTAEFGCVVRDQDQGVGESNCGDKQVIWPDNQAPAGEVGPDRSTLIRSGIIEWKRGKRRHEVADFGQILGYIFASQGAEKQFGHNDGAQNDIARSRGRELACDRRSGAVPKVLDARIAVEQILHGSASRVS